MKEECRKKRELEFINKCKDLHNSKYDYSLVNYVGTHTKVCIVCSDHGEFFQDPGNHLKGQGCPKCWANNRNSDKRSSKDEFVRKAIKIHENKYNYNKVEYLNSRTKVIINCSIHGDFNITPNDHINNKNGCPKCGHLKHTKTFDQFVEEANIIHNAKYLYSNDNYINMSTKIPIVCKIHGEFYQNPSSHISGRGCPKCKSSNGEKIIMDWLNTNNINFISEFRIKIPNLENTIKIDFVLQYNNVQYFIEYNGIQHYEYNEFLHKYDIENLYKQQKRDTSLKLYCLENNIKFIEIKYDITENNVVKLLENEFK